MKHIKVKAKLLPDSRFFRLTILEQTHLQDDFGDDLVGGIRMFRYKDIALISASYPQYVSADNFHKMYLGHLLDTGIQTVLYVRGYNSYAYSPAESMPVELWPKIREAVNYYNRLYA